jgi:hypothetical protein
MKILALASLTPPATANYLIGSLRGTGHEVFVCSDVMSPLADLRVRGEVDVAHICAQCSLEPDLVLFIEGGTMRLFPVGLEHIECRTAWYGIDTHMDYAKHLRIGRLFDVTFIAQKEFVDRLRKDGLRQVYWLPLAFAPELFPAETPELCYDVAYVGSSNATVHPIRHALLTSIQSEFPNVFVGLASPSDMVCIYAQAKLVFNKSINNDVNMRYFEAMGAGAVLLTDPVLNNGADELFCLGVHYFEYRDKQTLLALIRSLLQDPECCHRTGDAARHHVLANHTYRHRTEQLLDTMRESIKLPPPRQEDYFPALMSLRLLDAALLSVGRTAANASGGKRRRIVGWVTNIVMITLAAGVSLIEYLQDFLRRK